MDTSYKLAPITNRDDILEEISKYEHELKSKTRSDIVLIAYSKDSLNK